jgi:tetratricopeptide (TPR) repeat protein
MSIADMKDDPMLMRISDALDLYNAGRRTEAREAFDVLWAELGDGDPFHQCILAHYMADAQDDPADELEWDRRALAAADRISRVRPDAASLTILSLYPSLHLNLADVLHRTGDLASARKHLQLARQSTDALADDSYGEMIRNGIERLATRLAASG